MSTEEDKIKRTKRMQKDECAVAKQVKIAKAAGMDVKETHKFAKHHAMDCGRSGCVMCGSPRKVWNESTIQEKSFDQTSKWTEE
jgi:hypothetical protein